MDANRITVEPGKRSGPPPKIIWLPGCNYPTAVAERLIRGQAIRVTESIAPC